MKAQHDLAMSSGYYAEYFARTKKMKALAEYLKPPVSADEQREQDLARLVAKLDSMAAKGGSDADQPQDDEVT